MANEPTVREQIAEFNPDALFMYGHDDALIGVVTRFGMGEVACYDYDKVIAGLMKDGMTEEQAVEFHEFNQIGAWMGEGTPAFLRLLTAKSSS